VVVSVTVRRRTLNPMIIFFADVELAADDRLNSRSFRRIHEMNGTEDIAVVGHGHGRHAKLFCTMAELLDITSAVEHGVVGVEMQVNELGHSCLDFTLLGVRGKARSHGVSGENAVDFLAKTKGDIAAALNKAYKFASISNTRNVHDDSAASIVQYARCRTAFLCRS